MYSTFTDYIAYRESSIWCIRTDSYQSICRHNDDRDQILCVCGTDIEVSILHFSCGGKLEHSYLHKLWKGIDKA